MRYSVERIEENIVICEADDGSVLKLKLYELPQGIREGDIIDQTENGFVVNSAETESRRKKMAEMQRNIFGKKR